MRDHTTRRGAAWTALGCGLLLCAAQTGCRELGSPGWSNPFASKPSKALTEPLETVRTSQNPAERVQALGVLRTTAAQKGPDEQAQIVAELRLMLQRERNPFLRADAVRTLAGCNVPQTEDALQAASLDSSSSVRMACCGVLGERRNGPALDLLARMATDDADTDVRLEAVKALGRFEGGQAVPILAQALDSDNPAMQYRAMQSLGTATKQDLGSDVEAWKAFAQGRPATPRQTSIAERLSRPWF